MPRSPPCRPGNCPAPAGNGVSFSCQPASPAGVPSISATPSPASTTTISPGWSPPSFPLPGDGPEQRISMIVFSSEKITEPGLWLQWDWGKGPPVPGPDGTPRDTLLFCAWLAWSRFRVVLPVWDRTLPTLIACLDATLRRIGGAPVYALPDYVARHIIGL